MQHQTRSKFQLQPVFDHSFLCTRLTNAFNGLDRQHGRQFRQYDFRSTDTNDQLGTQLPKGCTEGRDTLQQERQAASSGTRPAIAWIQMLPWIQNPYAHHTIPGWPRCKQRLIVHSELITKPKQMIDGVGHHLH